MQRVTALCLLLSLSTVHSETCNSTASSRVSQFSHSSVRLDKLDLKEPIDAEVGALIEDAGVDADSVLAQVSTSRSPTFPPALNGEFEDAELLGEGTAGVVWAAHWTKEGRLPVAVKVARKGILATAEEWQNECENAERLQGKCVTAQEKSLFTKCFYPRKYDDLPKDPIYYPRKRKYDDLPKDPIYMVMEPSGYADLEALFFFPHSIAPALPARRHLLKNILEAVIVMLRPPNALGTGDLHFGNVMAARNVGSTSKCPYNAKLIDFENNERGINPSERQRRLMLDDALQLWLLSELYGGVDSSTMAKGKEDVAVFKSLMLFAPSLPITVELTKSDLGAGKTDFALKEELFGAGGGRFLRDAVARMPRENYAVEMVGFFDTVKSLVPEAMRDQVGAAHLAVSGQWTDIRKKLQVPPDADDVTFVIADCLVRLRAGLENSMLLQQLSAALDSIPDC